MYYIDSNVVHFHTYKLTNISPIDISVMFIFLVEISTNSDSLWSNTFIDWYELRSLYIIFSVVAIFGKICSSICLENNLLMHWYCRRRIVRHFRQRRRTIFMDVVIPTHDAFGRVGLDLVSMVWTQVGVLSRGTTTRVWHWM